MKPGSFLLLIVLALLLQSCFKEDIMVEPHPKGDVTTDTIPMTENYINQAWYSLDSTMIVSLNKKTSYDLGFECSPSGWRVILNSSNFMKVGDLGIVPFGLAYDTTGLLMRFDKSDGNPDSTAIDVWYQLSGPDTVSNNHVYAVNRGMDELGNPLGLYQVIFDSLKHGTYYFRYAPLTGGTGTVGSVSKSGEVNYHFFSLKSGIPVSVEPPANSYDLLFTQYTTMLFTDEGIPYPYLVTGVLLNRHLVVAAMDSTVDFLSLSRDQAMTLQYSKAMDIIGYDWKYYDFDAGIYTIRPNMTYIVRSINGFYFKLRFTAFYNRDGLKGYPVIEYQRL